MIQCIDIALNLTYHSFHSEMSTSYVQWCDAPSLHKDIPGMEVSYIPHLWDVDVLGKCAAMYTVKSSCICQSLLSND